MNKWQEIRTLSKISQLYYQDGYTQQQIADRFSLPRSNISHLLKQAKKLGLVQIHISVPDNLFLDWERKLERTYHLREAIILPCWEELSASSLKTQIGEVAASYLKSIIGDGDILGIAWGSTVREVVRMLLSQKKYNSKVIQAVGALESNSSDISSNKLVIQAADALGGEPYLLQAPLVVRDKKVKNMLLQEPQIKEAINLIKRANILLAGIGVLEESSLLIQCGLITHEEFGNLEAHGAVGEICGRFFDNEGDRVPSDLDEKVIGIRLEDFKKSDYSMMVTAGVRKVPALMGALRGNLFNVLVTDEKTAKAVLETHECK